MKVYIAGRITGDPRYREKFAEAEAALRGEGHIPLNPAVLPEGMEKDDYMRICTAMLDSADAIGLLGDWTSSPGAQLEMHYADYVGKKKMDLWKMLAVRRSTASSVDYLMMRTDDLRPLAPVPGQQLVLGCWMPGGTNPGHDCDGLVILDVGGPMDPGCTMRAPDESRRYPDTGMDGSARLGAGG